MNHALIVYTQRYTTKKRSWHWYYTRESFCHPSYNTIHLIFSSSLLLRKTGVIKYKRWYGFTLLRDFIFFLNFTFHVFCSACKCNGHASMCNPNNGKCFCTTKGIKGDRCHLWVSHFITLIRPSLCPPLSSSAAPPYSYIFFSTSAVPAVLGKLCNCNIVVCYN